MIGGIQVSAAPVGPPPWGVDSDVTIDYWPKEAKTIGREPDPKLFELIAPGKTTNLELSDRVVSRKGDKISMKANDSVWVGIRVDFAWGWEEDAEDSALGGPNKARLWNSLGDLLYGEASTDWVLLDLPALSACKVPGRERREGNAESRP